MRGEVEQHPDVTEETSPGGAIIKKYKGVTICIDYPLTKVVEPLENGERWVVTWVIDRFNYKENKDKA